MIYETDAFLRTFFPDFFRVISTFWIVFSLFPIFLTSYGQIKVRDTRLTVSLEFIVVNLRRGALLLFKCYKVRPHSESGRPVCHHFLGVYTKETNSRILLSCQQPSVNHTHRPDTTFSDFLLAQSQLDFGGGGVWSSIKILRPHRVGGRRSDPIKKNRYLAYFFFFLTGKSTKAMP